MFRIASVALLAVGLLAINPLQGGGKSGKLSVGTPAPKFMSLPGVDGKKHSISDYKKPALVVVVTCNHCPVAVAYEDRIIAFTKKYGSKADVVAINVNNLEADKMPKMIERAKEKGFNFPYLYDESQKIAKDLGAKVTPHFYVFDNNRKLVYEGAMDNSMTNPTVSYLAPAVEAAAKGSVPDTTFTKARGCSVKYQK